jgi:hypothetical protein
MRVRVLDLDGGIPRQATLMRSAQPLVHDLRRWGPRIRLACRFGRFAKFEKSLAKNLGEESPSEPTLTLFGSGDFHHVSLALLRRQQRPFNLLVLDNHPDWMRAIPFLHCGTWLYHAARLPQVQQIFHVGGNMDFDNGFRRLAPWPLLRSGKIRVFPAMRYFRRRPWSEVANEPVRPNADSLVTDLRLHELLHPYRSQLEKYPLYISLDKDVMVVDDAVVNWDSGHLTLPEVEIVLSTFLAMARGNLAGMDILGDWSAAQTGGLFRRYLHWTEHPALTIDPAQANRLNERTNLMLLNMMLKLQPAVPERAAVPLAA